MASIARRLRDQGRQTMVAVAPVHAQGGSLLRDARALMMGRRLPPAIARLATIIADVDALMRDREPRPRVVAPTAEADLVEARLMLSHWRGRAEKAEAKVVALEARLARAEVTALDLRSRVVCLHGKLATSTATVRYQSMTLALETQAGPAAPAMALD